MNDITPRKRSPRAPSCSLGEALEKALVVYQAEGRHPAPIDVVAQHLGYKSSANGAAKQALASIRYYGLFERSGEGTIAVSKEVEEYKFSPSEQHRNALLQKWLRSPEVFAELLDRYTSNLPSEATLKFDLIRRGFNPTTADEVLTSFLQSVALVPNEAPLASLGQPPTQDDINLPSNSDAESREPAKGSLPQRQTAEVIQEAYDGEDHDRIPVRLAGGRKAWLVIPSPFYAADKRRLISQIELLLTDDEVNDF